MTANRNGILAMKTVWHELLLRHMFFAYYWNSCLPKISKKIKKAKKILKAKPKVQNPKFQNSIIFSADMDDME